MPVTKRPRGAGFTLVEVMLVIAILSVLAAILFPVFAGARSAAKKAVCISNAKQVTMALQMYVNDYDDRMVLSNSDARHDRTLCWGCGRPDYVWSELIQPYVRNFEVFRSPADPNANDASLSIHNWRAEPIDQRDPDFYYSWMSRTNYGLNYLFLSPWSFQRNGPHGSRPIEMTQVQSPAGTLMVATSIWYRNPDTGAPEGGGNWVIEPPCIVDEEGNNLLPPPHRNLYNYGWGWVTNSTGKAPFHWMEFGGAWAFHEGGVNAGFVDGHVRVVPIGRLAAGCDVKSYFGGAAYDGEAYLYDLR